MERDTTVERIIVLMRDDNIYDEANPAYPAIVKGLGCADLDDQQHDWPHPDIEHEGNALVVNGRRFPYERSTDSRWINRHLGSERGYIYRYPRGWRVLSEYDGENGLRLRPTGTWPLEDRLEAWQKASNDVTSTLARFNEARKAVLVWQDGEEFSEPLAELDGRNHTQGEAIRALGADELFAWDWEAEACPERSDRNEPEEDAPSPGSEAPPVQEKPDDPDSNTNGGNGQDGDTELSEYALTILYVGMAPRPTETQGASGKLLQVELDGEQIDPPAHNIYECRQWARENGYTVNYPRWQVTHKANGRHGQARREVYTRQGQPEPVNLTGIPTSPPVTEEMETRWLAKAEKEKAEEIARRRATGDRGAGSPFVDPFYRQNRTSGRKWRNFGGP